MTFTQYGSCRRQHYCTPSHRYPSSSNPSDAVGDITGAVQAIAVKVPTFWPTHPEVWFSLLESQFATKNITADDTKYHHATQGRDKTTAEDISAFLLNPPAIGKLDALKTLLISTIGLTQADKDASLLAISGLGDRKPSGLLRYMKSLTTTDDQKSMVYRALSCSSFQSPFMLCLPKILLPASLILPKLQMISLQPRPQPLASLQSWQKKMGRRVHPSSGKTGTRCFYHAKFGKKARKCGDTSSAATCDMAHLTELGKRLYLPAASRQSGRQSSSRRKKHDVCLGS